MTLDQVKPGTSCTIVKVHGEGALTQRLQEMGLIEGETIKVIKLAPLGDPMEISVYGYNLTLRKSEAKNIAVTL